MAQVSIRSKIHRRFSCFVDWIATEQEKEEEIRRQADEIRGRIRGQAEADGLVIRSTPYSGSYPKRTGLRRHLQGDSVVEGQDVDLPFVVSPQTRDQEDVNSLLDRFERYAAVSYPQVSRNTTKSSICLSFKATRISYDLVPMLATEDPEAQILLRSNGARQRTSVQKNIEFIRRRTRASNDLPGRVKFNEGVRLVKWWREFRQAESQVLPMVATVVIDLLFAKAYDQCQVEPTYPETLARWFLFAAHAARQRQRIAFTDYGPAPSTSATALWSILDPVNPNNNVVAPWAGWELEEFTGWLERGRDSLARAVRYDDDGDDAASLRCLVELFGSPFKHHCGDDR